MINAVPIRENKFARRARNKREELKGVAPGDALASGGEQGGEIEEEEDRAPTLPEKDARKCRPDDGDDLFPS